MKVEIKDLDKIQKEVKVSLNLGDMEKYLQGASERLGKDIKIKGFREGNIPRSVVESSLGKDKVWQEATNAAVQDTYWSAIEDNKINPIGMPKVDIVKFVPGELVEFKAIVPVMPDLELPNYKALAQKVIAKENKEVEVDEKEIDSSIKWLQNSRMEVGEEAKEEKVPELNDDFAKSIGNFENMDALKSSIGEGIKKEKEAQEKERVRLLILNKIAKSVDLSIPDFMVDQELDSMEEEFMQQVSQMGLTMEQYLERAQKSIEEVREGWRDKAKERVASGIILRVIAEKENIEADEKEVQEEANKYLARFKGTEEAEAHIDSERLKAHIGGIIRNRKVFQLLEENN
ncbi:MAG: trigger factor [Candidatus Spechtbacterales bacterium]